MTREECEKALHRAPAVLPSDDMQRAILATLLRIEEQGKPKRAPRKPRTKAG